MLNATLLPGSLFLVPTLCVGTPRRTLCVPASRDSGRRASRGWFPRGAWEPGERLVPTLRVGTRGFPRGAWEPGDQGTLRPSRGRDRLTWRRVPGKVLLGRRGR